METKKSFELWADDDWTYCSIKELKELIVEAKSLPRIFHYKKSNCYEGKPRKICITIEEIK